jgi:hypothetical protein
MEEAKLPEKIEGISITESIAGWGTSPIGITAMLSKSSEEAKKLV